MKVDDIRLSKALSHALRHAPDAYGLERDRQGAVPIEELVIALRRRRQAWSQLTADDIIGMMQRAEKQRFTIEGGKIRAGYGHSLPYKIARTATAPPPTLYHGTTAVAAANILRVGLLPMRRQYVHLSCDVATAVAVGSRRTAKPVIVTVRALAAWAEGVPFYRESDSVWLAEQIAPIYIEIK